MKFWQMMLLTLIVLSYQQCTLPYLPLQTISDDFISGVSSLAISLDGQYIVAGKGEYFKDRQAVLYKNNGGQFNKLGTSFFQIPYNEPNKLNRRVDKFSGDSSKLLLASDKFTIYDVASIQDLNTAIPLKTLQIPGKQLYHNALSYDGNTLFASVYESNAAKYQLYIFKIGETYTLSQKPLSTLLPYYWGLRMSPNGKYLLSFSNNQAQIHVEDQNNPGQYLSPTLVSSSRFDSSYFTYEDADLTDDILVISGFNTLRIFKRLPNNFFSQLQILQSLFSALYQVQITRDQNYIILYQQTGDVIILKKNSSSLYQQKQRISNASLLISASNDYLVFGRSPSLIMVYTTCSFCIGKQGMFKDGNQCKLCNANCRTCASNSNNCLTCRQSMYLNGNQCYQCDSSCKTCAQNPYKCLSCQSSYYVTKDNTCASLVPILVGTIVGFFGLIAIIIVITYCFCFKSKINNEVSRISDQKIQQPINY